MWYAALPAPQASRAFTEKSRQWTMETPTAACIPCPFVKEKVMKDVGLENMGYYKGFYNARHRHI
jgi:hypothetical protein